MVRRSKRRVRLPRRVTQRHLVPCCLPRLQAAAGRCACCARASPATAAQLQTPVTLPTRQAVLPCEACLLRRPQPENIHRVGVGRLARFHAALNMLPVPSHLLPHVRAAQHLRTQQAQQQRHTDRQAALKGACFWRALMLGQQGCADRCSLRSER